jgi:hypothetical protein
VTPREFKRSVAPEIVAQAAMAVPLPVADMAEPPAEPRAPARPLYAAVRPFAPGAGTGLRDLEQLPLPSFLMATPAAAARALTPVPP